MATVNPVGDGPVFESDGPPPPPDEHANIPNVKIAIVACCSANRYFVILPGLLVWQAIPDRGNTKAGASSGAVGTRERICKERLKNRRKNSSDDAVRSFPGNPAILGPSVRKIGGFASPPFGGFAVCQSGQSLIRTRVRIDSATRCPQSDVRERKATTVPPCFFPLIINWLLKQARRGPAVTGPFPSANADTLRVIASSI